VSLHGPLERPAVVAAPCSSTVHWMIRPLDFVPIWAMMIVIAAVFLGACVTGYRFGSSNQRPEESNQVHILSATLALLGLLVGFTFSLALGRYDARRRLVVEEANAIGTAYLRAQLAPEPFRSQLIDHLRQYGDARLALSAAGEGREEIARVETLTDSLQQRMWRITVAAVPNVQPPAVSSIIASAINTVIDIAATRSAELSARLPPSVIAALLLYATVASSVLGFVTGRAQQHSRVPSFILLLLLTLALGLIFDLDRARSGTIRVSQQPLLDVQAMMKSR
jgi:hypothetical protein